MSRTLSPRHLQKAPPHGAFALNRHKNIFLIAAAVLILCGALTGVAAAEGSNYGVFDGDTQTSTWNTLAEAYNNAASGNTIKVLQNVAENPVKMSGTKNIILDLNDLIITFNKSPQNQINWDSPGYTLTIKGNSEGSSNTGTIDAYSNKYYTRPIIVTRGTVILTSGTIKNGNWENCGGVYVQPDGNFEMQGGVITMCTGSSNGGAVYVNGGTFTMTGGSITGNKNTGSGGGGVYVVTGGTFTMTGGSITGNTAKVNGGGVYVATGGTFTVGGTAQITGNKMGSAANNVYLESGVFMTLSTEESLTTGANIGVTTADIPTADTQVKITDTTAANYTVFKSDNTRYKITQTDAVYLSMNYCYEVFAGTEPKGKTPTLAEAYALVPETGGTIKVLKNVTETAAVTMSGTKNVTLDLQGHILTGNGSASVIAVSGGATLILIDTNPDSLSHYFTYQSNNRWTLYEGTPGQYVELNAFDRSTAVSGTTIVHIPGGVITGGGGTTASNGGGVNVTTGSAFTMESGYIVGNSAKWGGGVCVNNSTFTMNGGSIVGNWATSNTSGGLHLDANAKVTMSGGSIIGNSSKQQGGGVRVSQSTFKMTGGSIKQNSASSSNGGGVWVDKNGGFTMESGYIVGNSAKWGGGVCANGGTFTMNGGEITGNRAANTGGGLHLDSATATMSGGSIIGNSSVLEGGGVRVSKSTFKMTGGSITQNSATKDGGGVWVDNNDSSKFTMTGGGILTNTTEGNGGGVCVTTKGMFTVGGTAQITGNKKGSDANNVYLPSGKTMTLSSTALTTGASIGVTTAVAPKSSAPVQITNGYGTASSNYCQYITSDSTSYQTKDLKRADSNAKFAVYLGIPPLVTVTFDLNGKGEQTPDPQDLFSGMKVVKPEDPEVTGYIFSGWFKEAACTNEWKFDTDTATKDITLHAKWTLKSPTVSGETTTTYGTAVTLTAGVDSGFTPASYQWYEGDSVISGATSSTYTVPANTAKGEHTYKVKITDSTPLSAESAPHTVTVSALSVTITGLSAQNKEYDGTTTAAVTGTAVISGKIEGDDLSVASGTAAFADANAGTGKTVTFSGYSLTGAAAGNYTLTAQPVAVTADITAKEVGLNWTNTSLTYNGSAQKPTATATSLVGSDTCTVTVTGEQTNVGTYDATATGLSNSNYKLPSPATHSFTINTKPVTVTWPETKSFKWDGTAKTIEAAIGDVVSGDDVSFTYTDNSKTDAGSYTAKVTGLSGAKKDNYSLPASGLECSWSIVKDKYTVKFDANGHGTAPASQSVTSGEKATEPTPAPTEPGYTFEGWFKEATCTNKWKFDTDTVTGNITLYAKWTANTYTITYKDQGDAAYSGNNEESLVKTHTYGTATPLVSGTKTGYTFGGWFTDRECTGDPVTTIGATDYTADFTLYAKWTVNTYTITYKDQGDAAYSGNNKESLVKTHVYDTATTLVAGTKTGYTFGGWFTDRGCTGNPVTTIGATDYTADFTLYAKWTADIPPYTITFNGNGGTVTPSTLVVYYGETVNLSTAVTVTPRSGYTHSGWALSPNGPAVYAAGQSVKDLGNITLYAVWTPVEKQHTLTVKVTHGDELVSGAAVTLRQGNIQWGTEKTTGVDGKATFDNVPEGVYTVEASNGDGKTKTKAVTIPVEGNEITINLPTEKVSSKVDVKSDAGTPSVAVEGADTVAEAQKPEEGQSITVTVIVESKTDDGSAPETQKEIDEIKNITPAGSKVEYLGITIEKKTETTGESPTTESITNTDNVLEFLIPYDFTNKTEINLYRCHKENEELVAKPLIQLSEKPAVPEDGGYWLDRANSLIHLYSKKFSTYSVGYFEGSKRPSHSTPSGSSIWIQEPVPAADEKITSTDVTAAYAGIVFIQATTVELRQIEAVNAAYAELISASLEAAEHDGVPLTNSKGAKVIITTPDEIPGIQKETFAQVIDVESADGSKVTSVPFKVRLSDLAAKNLTTDDVTLYHYLEEYGLWVPLETRLVSTDDGYAYYEAATDGASPFGVLLKKLDAPEVKPVPTQTGKTPVPIMGVLAGLGAAGVVFGLRMRR